VLPELLSALTARNVTLWVESGDRLRYRAPKGALTPELLDTLKAHKAEVLAWLAAQDARVIPHLPDAEHYALSQAQWRLWMLLQIEGGVAYHVPLHQRLEGSLERAALERALTALVTRHESLRTTFITINSEPRQRISSDAASLAFVDLSAQPDPEAAARTAARAETLRPFDLEGGPLLRATLLKLAPQTHVLLLTLHHIISDGVSIGVLVRDLGQLYGAFMAGQPDPLPPLRLHYRDFAAWQNQQLQDEALAIQRAYWQDKLGGELPTLNLPTDFPRPPVQTFEGTELPFALDEAALAGLMALAQQHHATLFMVLLALFKTVLYHYTTQTDLIVGSPIAGRAHADLENQIGFYLNTLALRTTLDPTQSFAENLRAVRQTVTEAFDHQDYPFDFLVNELKLQRDFSRAPLFDVMLILQNQDERGALGDLQMSAFELESPTSKYDLTLYCKAVNGRLLCGVEYNTALFAPDRMARLCQHFQTLAASVVADPQTPLGELNLLPVAERELLESFNATAAPYPIEKTVVDIFEAQAAREPDKIALVATDATLTYAELNQRANVLAHKLRAQFNLQPEDRVGVLLNRTSWLVVGLWGILKTGAAYVPLDPAYPAERIAYMLDQSACKAVLTETELVALCGETPHFLADSAWPAEHTENPRVPLTPENLIYIIYTSGSTGQPKGVMVNHRNVVNYWPSLETDFGLRASDRFFALTTVTFDPSVLELINGPMLGLRLILAPNSDLLDAEALLALLQREQATVLQLTPSRLKLLLEGRDSSVLASLRVLLVGGEPFPSQLLERLRPLMARGLSVRNIYGPTETTMWATVKDLAQGDITLGQPIKNYRMYVVNEHLAPAPMGVLGEICVAGEGMTRGYCQRPDLTAERFVDWRGQRLYRSGDLGYWRANGELVYGGRNDFQVKIRGFRVELGEIEAGLLRHPAVQAAAVLAPADAAGEHRVLAFVVLRAGQTLTLLEARQFLRQTLPDYMLPSALIPLDKLPVTPNGKLDRKALLAQVEVSPTPAENYVAPRTPTETALVGIWQAVLEIAAPPSVRADFFSLGGHSLKAMRIAAQAQRELGVAVNLLEVLRQQTIENLAAHIDAVPRITPDIAAPTDEELALLDDDDA